MKLEHYSASVVLNLSYAELHVLEAALNIAANYSHHEVGDYEFPLRCGGVSRNALNLLCDRFTVAKVTAGGRALPADVSDETKAIAQRVEDAAALIESGDWMRIP